MQNFKHCKISVTGLFQAQAIGKNIHFLLFARLLQWFGYSWGKRGMVLMDGGRVATGVL